MLACNFEGCIMYIHPKLQGRKKSYPFVEDIQRFLRRIYTHSNNMKVSGDTLLRISNEAKKDFILKSWEFCNIMFYIVK